MPTVAHYVHTWLAHSETFIFQQARFARDFQPLILARYAQHLETYGGFEMVLRDGGGPLEWLRDRLAPPGVSACFRRALRQRPAALIHGHFGHHAWTALPLRRATGLPLVTSFYSRDSSALPRDPIWRDRYAELFAEGQRFLAISDDMRRDLIALGCPEARIAVNRLGTDLALFPFQPPPPRPTGAPLRLLFVGRFTEKKGVLELLEAVARAVRTRPMALDLIGYGELQDQVEERRSRLGLAEAVGLLGHVPYAELPAQYRAHDFLVLPSRQAASGDKDDLSMVVLEAMATGLPVIYTDHAGCVECFRDGEHLLVARAADTDSLSDQLARAAALPGPEAAAMAERARAQVEEVFDVRRQMERQEAIYRELA